MMMPEYIAVTIRIPRETWKTIESHTWELQERARDQGMADVVFDSYVHAAMLLQQVVDMEEAQRKRR